YDPVDRRVARGRDRLDHSAKRVLHYDRVDRAGAIDSIIVQNPFRMGYESARAIGMKLNGQTPQRKLDSGAALIRAEDLDRPETRELLFPDIQKYLQAGR